MDPDPDFDSDRAWIQGPRDQCCGTKAVLTNGSAHKDDRRDNPPDPERQVQVELGVVLGVRTPGGSGGQGPASGGEGWPLQG